MPKGIANGDKVDGRTLKATGRNQQFATRVTKEWHEKVKTIAERDGLMLVEVLERAVDAYEREQGEGSLLARMKAMISNATPQERAEAAALLNDKVQATSAVDRFISIPETAGEDEAHRIAEVATEWLRQQS
jgi:hypothetical protein